MLPEISVLMAVYNEEKPEYLSAALKSVFEQTLRPREVVLVKDGPLGYDLEEVIGIWKKKERDLLKIVELKTNKGLARALNFGLRRCSCELIARMDTNDVSTSDRLECEVKYLQDSGADVVGSYIEERDEKMDRVLHTRKVPLLHEDIVRYSALRNPVNHMTALFKKNAILSVGGYNTRLKKMQDYVLWVKLMKAGYKFANVPEPLVKVRTGEDFLARRGGFSYFRYDVTALVYLRRLGDIGFFSLATSLFARFLTRMSPVLLRGLIYRRMRNGGARKDRGTHEKNSRSL